MKTNRGNSFIQKYIIAIYFIITFFLTVLLGMLCQVTHSIFISPQYAPTIGFVLICAMSKDWSAWGKIHWISFKNFQKLFWLFIALCLPVAVILISSLTMGWAGIPFVSWKDTPSGYITTLAAAVLGCITEEIGWRGFLLPKFREKHSMFTSAVGVGFLWGIWHCKFAYGALGFLLFVIAIVSFSILMAWIYMKTNGNLLCMIFFHFGVNIGAVTLLQQKEGALAYGVMFIVSALICTPVILRNKTEFFQKAC